jgi:hypothetical protein
MISWASKRRDSIARHLLATVRCRRDPCDLRDVGIAHGDATEGLHALGDHGDVTLPRNGGHL